MGMGVGAVAYFMPNGNPTTSLTEISFQHHAFFLYLCCRGAGGKTDFFMGNTYWKKTVGALIGAIWLYTLADIAANLLDPIDSLLNSNSWMETFAGMMQGESMFDLFDVLGWLLGFLTIFGYVYFYILLSRFMYLQPHEADHEGVRRIRLSYILMVVALFAGFLGMLGTIAAFVIIIISYIKMLSGWRMLKNSETYTMEARRGAAMLFKVAIFTLVAKVVGLLPLIGAPVEAVMLFILFFCTLAGWRRIQRGAPELSSEMTVVQQSFAEKEQRSTRYLVFTAWGVFLALAAAVSMLLGPDTSCLYALLITSALLLLVSGICLKQSEEV